MVRVSGWRGLAALDTRTIRNRHLGVAASDRRHWVRGRPAGRPGRSHRWGPARWADAEVDAGGARGGPVELARSCGDNVARRRITRARSTWPSRIEVTVDRSGRNRPVIHVDLAPARHHPPAGQVPRPSPVLVSPRSGRTRTANNRSRRRRLRRARRRQPPSPPANATATTSTPEATAKPNRALHMIAVCRLRSCPKTRAYAARRTATARPERRSCTASNATSPARPTPRSAPTPPN